VFGGNFFWDTMAKKLTYSEYRTTLDMLRRILRDSSAMDYVKKIIDDRSYWLMEAKRLEKRVHELENPSILNTEQAPKPYIRPAIEFGINAPRMSRPERIYRMLSEGRLSPERIGRWFSESELELKTMANEYAVKNGLPRLEI